MILPLIYHTCMNYMCCQVCLVHIKTSEQIYTHADFLFTISILPFLFLRCLCCCFFFFVSFLSIVVACISFQSIWHYLTSVAKAHQVHNYLYTRSISPLFWSILKSIDTIIIIAIIITIVYRDLDWYSLRHYTSI